MSRNKTSPRTSLQEGSVQPDLPPATHDIGTTLADSLHDRWQEFSSCVTETRHAITKKRIHDLRVATRRLLAFLDIAATLLPGKTIPRLRRRLKRHLRPFGLLRDVQLQGNTVRELVAQFPFLDPLRKELSLHARTMMKGAGRELRKIDAAAYETIISQIQLQLQSLVADPIMGHAAVSVVLGSLAQGYLEASVLKGAAMSGQSARIHRFRISFKRFRYMVEALQPFLPPLREDFFKSMNDYQTRMGAIQDLEVLMESLREWNRRHKRIGVQFLPLKEEMERKHKELITLFLASANEFERFWETIHQPTAAGNVS